MKQVLRNKKHAGSPHTHADLLLDLKQDADIFPDWLKLIT